MNDEVGVKISIKSNLDFDFFSSCGTDYLQQTTELMRAVRLFPPRAAEVLGLETKFNLFPNNRSFFFSSRLHLLPKLLPLITLTFSSLSFHNSATTAGPSSTSNTPPGLSLTRTKHGEHAETVPAAAKSPGKQ